MNKLSVSLIATAGFLLVSQAFADTDIAFGKTVVLDGTFGTNPAGWSSAPSAPASSLTDGVSLPETTQWNLGSVWWNGNDHPNNFATISLGSLYKINSFNVQADNNDTYRIQYKVGNGSWQNAWDIPAVNSYGLVTRNTTLGLPIFADALRFSATGGDGLYSVSEIQANGVIANPVPEPETYAMMLLGLGVVGTVTRRQKNKSPLSLS